MLGGLQATNHGGQVIEFRKEMATLDRSGGMIEVDDQLRDVPAQLLGHFGESRIGVLVLVD